MSTQDKSKEKRLRLIRQSIAFGLSTEDSLEHLMKNGITISERTLRRDKEELKQQYGNNVRDLVDKEIASDIFRDLFAYQEIQTKCWNLIQNEKTTTDEKIRLFGCMTKTISEKYNLPKKLPYNVRAGKIIPTSDENSPFEVTLQKPRPSLDSDMQAFLYKISAKNQKQNDRKTVNTSQESVPPNPFTTLT